MAEVTKNQYIDYDWTHERPGGWTEQAACVGQSHLFDVVDQINKDKKRVLGKWDSYDPVKFQQARDVCATCPVFLECLESATEEDLKWTVRAGRIPSIFNTRTDGSIERRKPKSHPRGGDVCINGHVGKWNNSASGRRCQECNKIRKARQRLRNGVQPRGRADTCRKGHVGQFVMEKSGRRCGQCRHGARWEEIKAAKLES